ncbi:hypothetical protein CVT25_006015 [Psilocybe cyanescens]|uniref:SH3 domain-containing protein n=1 Tax=Psilocybe cyanescens TaxID=93625 RepID=A0A409VMI8_PSICY|nr:hypothetical protein CVT25_006015 [Psilocybe cyanescens]
MPVVIARSDPGSSNGPTLANPIYLAGLIVALVILAGAGAWLGLRTYRKRMMSKRQEKTGAAFLSVKGLVRDDSNNGGEKEDFSQRVGKGFLSDINAPTIVFPDKALSPPALSATRDEVIDFHRRTGSIPKPFTSKPSLASPAFPASTLDSTASARNSWISYLGSNFSSNRASVLSTASSNISATTGSTRKVRQTFDPVLPDELLVNLSDQLTVVQSFDDGWCVVGRENKSLFPTAKSLFKPAAAPETTEMGVVPAWCFMKPVKGLRAERPMRSSSLGIVLNLEESGPSRHSIVTWSNF